MLRRLGGPKPTRPAVETGRQPEVGHGTAEEPVLPDASLGFLASQERAFQGTEAEAAILPASRLGGKLRGMALPAFCQTRRATGPARARGGEAQSRPRTGPWKGHAANRRARWEGRGSHLRTRSFPRSRPPRGSPSQAQQRAPAGPGRLSASCPSSSASVTNAALSTSDDARESVSFSQSHGRSLGRGAAVVPSGLLR